MPVGVIIFLIVMIIRFFVRRPNKMGTEEDSDAGNYTYVYPKLYEEEPIIETSKESVKYGEFECNKGNLDNMDELIKRDSDINMEEGLKIGDYYIEVKQQNNEESMEKEKIANIVKAYFESEEIKYDENYDLENDSIVLVTGFRGDREEDSILIKFVIHENLYNVIGWNEYSIPVECQIGCYVALNDYNLERKVKAFLIKDDGRIIYELVAITEGGAYSRASIIQAFELIMRSINEDTPRLFQQAYQYSKNMISKAPNKKKSWFRRQS